MALTTEVAALTDSTATAVSELTASLIGLDAAVQASNLSTKDKATFASAMNASLSLASDVLEKANNMQTALTHLEDRLADIERRYNDRPGIAGHIAAARTITGTGT